MDVYIFRRNAFYWDDDPPHTKCCRILFAYIRYNIGEYYLQILNKNSQTIIYVCVSERDIETPQFVVALADSIHYICN